MDPLPGSLRILLVRTQRKRCWWRSQGNVWERKAPQHPPAAHTQPLLHLHCRRKGLTRGGPWRKFWLKDDFHTWNSGAFWEALMSGPWRAPGKVLVSLVPFAGLVCYLQVCWRLSLSRHRFWPKQQPRQLWWLEASCSLEEQEQCSFVDAASFVYILNRNRWIFSCGRSYQHSWTYKPSRQLESGPEIPASCSTDVPVQSLQEGHYPTVMYTNKKGCCL